MLLLASLLTAATACHRPHLSRAPAPVATGVSTLTVTVHDDAGVPLPGIDVRIGEAEGRFGLTDEQGRVSLARVPAGDVYVTVATAGNMAPFYEGPGKVVTVPGSDQPLEVALVMRKGASVRGRIVDEAGRPVAGASVSAARADDARQLFSATAETDPDGTYVLDGIASGWWRVSVTLPEANFQFGAQDSAPFKVASTPVEGVDVTVQLGLTLSGRVVDHRGVGVAGASVSVARADLRAWPWSSVAESSTEDDGTFTLHHLPRTKLLVGVEHWDASGSTIEVDLTHGDAPPDLRLVLDSTGSITGTIVDETGASFRYQDIQLSLVAYTGGGLAPIGIPGARRRLQTDHAGAFAATGLADGIYALTIDRTPAFGPVYLATGASSTRIEVPSLGLVEGVVSLPEASLQGGVVVAIGAPPAGPITTLIGNGPLQLWLPLGTYRLHFSVDGADELVLHDVAVRAREHTDLGKISLRAAVRHLRGRVVDAAGIPVVGARIELGPDPLYADGRFHFDSAWPGRTRRSGRDGYFDVDAARGVATLRAAHDRGASEAIAIPEDAGDLERITLTLRPYGSLGGVVRDEAGVVPLVSLTATSASAPHVTYTTIAGADGAFMFEHLPEGAYLLAPVAEAYVGPEPIHVEVVAGGLRRAEVSWPGGGTSLAISLTCPQCRPGSIATLALFEGTLNVHSLQELTSTAQGSVASQIAKVGGRSTIYGVRAGEYSICAVPWTLGRPLSMPPAEAQPVYCAPVTVTAEPTQAVSLPVQPVP